MNTGCNLCPRRCNAPRAESAGFCGEGSVMRIARAALHYWEEPLISGINGSGTVFFTGCNLKCIYCQNASISESFSDHGKPGSGTLKKHSVISLTPDGLAGIFRDLKAQGAHNINLVTPSHFVPGICEAIRIAKASGFDLPFVYNSSAYETVETLRMLDGLIDIYLPDFKYMDPKKAADYSHATDYPETAKAAISEMFRQVGETSIKDSLLLKKGMIVRHLLLPLGVRNAISVIDYLYETYGEKIFLSIMNQFTPLYHSELLTDTQRKRLEPFPELHRKVTKREYDRVVQHCLDLNIKNVFIQEGEAALESFIPSF